MKVLEITKLPTYEELEAMAASCAKKGLDRPAFRFPVMDPTEKNPTAFIPDMEIRMIEFCRVNDEGSLFMMVGYYVGGKADKQIATVYLNLDNDNGHIDLR